MSSDKGLFCTFSAPVKLLALFSYLWTVSEVLYHSFRGAASPLTLHSWSDLLSFLSQRSAIYTSWSWSHQDKRIRPLDMCPQPSVHLHPRELCRVRAWCWVASWSCYSTFVFVKYGISNSVFTGLRIYMSDQKLALNIFHPRYPWPIFGNIGITHGPRSHRHHRCLLMLICFDAWHSALYIPLILETLENLTRYVCEYTEQWGGISKAWKLFDCPAGWWPITILEIPSILGVRPFSLQEMSIHIMVKCYGPYSTVVQCTKGHFEQPVYWVSAFELPVLSEVGSRVGCLIGQACWLKRACSLNNENSHKADLSIRY